jgi:hypothetical protein
MYSSATSMAVKNVASVIVADHPWPVQTWNTSSGVFLGDTVAREFASSTIRRDDEFLAGFVWHYAHEVSLTSESLSFPNIDLMRRTE